MLILLKCLKCRGKDFSATPYSRNLSETYWALLLIGSKFCQQESDWLISGQAWPYPKLWIDPFLDSFKLQQKNVCFDAVQSIDSTFKVKTSGLLTAVRLIHTSGTVACSNRYHHRSTHSSYWGCSDQLLLRVYVQNKDKEDIFPRGKKEKYTLPSFNKNSPSITFKDSVAGFSASIGDEFSLYYWDNSRSDNNGKTCTNVEAVIQPCKNLFIIFYFTIVRMNYCITQ